MTLQNPRQTNSTTVWPQTAFSWLELILKVIMVFASIGAVYQYFDIKQENRVKQTMQQLENFNSGKLQAAQLKLYETWDPYQGKIKEINEAKTASEQDRMQIQATVVLPVIYQKKLQPEIGLLIDFFENLQVCVRHRICDKQVSKDLFCGDAVHLFQLHRPWIEIQRAVIPFYASQMEAFVQTECH